MDRLGLAVVGAVVLGLCGWWWLHPTESVNSTSTEARDHAGQVASSSDRHPLTRTRGRWSFDRANLQYGDESDEPRDPHHAVVAGPESGETTPDWSSLSPTERLDRLESQFETAVGELESGDPEAASRAENALTALRPELYATPEGRERYAALESRLETLTENE